MKSEPGAYSVDDLAGEPQATATWDGVRNYQARNYLRDMKRGDRVLFYHSSCAEPAIVGLAEVVREAFPDPTQFDADDPHFDPKSDPDDPRWDAVAIRLVRKLDPPLSLAEMRTIPDLESMVVLRRGNRLSITPVSRAEWRALEGRLR